MVNRALFILIALTSFAFADGGTVIFQKQEGDFQITVFGLPSPLRAGPVDLSVLIQKIETREPILDAQVSLSVTPIAANLQPGEEIWTPPCCSLKRSDDFYVATRDQAQNKLMYHAFFPIPASGKWNLAVEVRRGNFAHYFIEPITVAPPLKPMWAYWPLLVLPFLIIGGFVLNRSLRWSRPRERGEPSA